MNIEQLKTQLVEMALKLDNENPKVEPLEYFRNNFFTIVEAIVYADSQGVKLRSNPIQQFHLLCKKNLLESVQVGDKTKIITKRSLDEWIATQKKKQENS